MFFLEMNHGSLFQPGSPRLERMSGVYYLRVVEIGQIKSGYSYTLEDAEGKHYKAKSRKLFSVGQMIRCNVSVVILQRTISVKVKSIYKHRAANKNKTLSPQARSIIQNVGAPGKRGSHKLGSVLNAPYKSKPEIMPTHGKEERFHLIYTPMGNKR